MLPYLGPEFIKLLLEKCNFDQNELEDIPPQFPMTEVLEAPKRPPRRERCWCYSRAFLTYIARLIRA